MPNKIRPILKSKHHTKFLFNNRNYLLLLAAIYLNIHLPSKQNPQYILQGSLDPIFRIIDVAKTFTSDMLPCHRYLLNVCNVICFAFIKLVGKIDSLRDRKASYKLRSDMRISFEIMDGVWWMF